MDIKSGWQPDAPERKTVSGTVFDIFLNSPFMPEPAWEEPVPNLHKHIDAAPLSHADTPADSTSSSIASKMEKLYTAYIQVEGFNNHWQKPRPSRRALDAGSVMRIVFPENVTLPEQLSLGGSQLEGYGNILINPPFLRDPLPEIKLMPKKAADKSISQGAPLSGPVINVLRERALLRTAEKQANNWLYNPEWSSFIYTASKNALPGAAQIANLQNMDKAAFTLMLDKTPGAQWKEAIAYDPFKKRKDFLEAIIKKLLDMDEFLATFPVAITPLLPGGEMNPAVKMEFSLISYRQFKRELLRAWTKAGRSGSSARGGN